MTYRLNDLIGKITCADCLDVLRDLPDKCVDLVNELKGAKNE